MAPLRIVSTDGESDTLAHANTIAEPRSVRAENGQLRVRDADEVLLLISAATDYMGFAGRKTADPLRASQADMERAAAKTYAGLREAQMAGEIHTEADARALGTERRADLEQAEVVVVARARQLQEGGGHARLAGDDAHAEGGVVEGDAALEVGDVEDGVVEPHGGDGHAASVANS